MLHLKAIFRHILPKWPISRSITSHARGNPFTVSNTHGTLSGETPLSMCLLSCSRGTHPYASVCLSMPCIVRTCTIDIQNKTQPAIAPSPRNPCFTLATSRTPARTCRLALGLPVPAHHALRRCHISACLPPVRRRPSSSSTLYMCCSAYKVTHILHGMSPPASLSRSPCPPPAWTWAGSVTTQQDHAILRPGPLAPKESPGPSLFMLQPRTVRCRVALQPPASVRTIEGCR